MYIHAHHRRAYYSSLLVANTEREFQSIESEIARPLPRPLQDQLFCMHVNKTRAPDHLSSDGCASVCMTPSLYLFVRMLLYCIYMGTLSLMSLVCYLRWTIDSSASSLCFSLCVMLMRVHSEGALWWSEERCLCSQSAACSLWSFGALITGRKWKLPS